MMQNHYEISSKTLFWSQNMQNWTKSRDLVMSRPAKSWFGHVRTCPRGQVLTSKQRKYFFFFEILHLSIFYDQYLLQNSGNIFFWDFTPFHFLLANLLFFIRSCVFMIKFIIFYKIKKYGPIWAPTRTWAPGHIGQILRRELFRIIFELFWGHNLDCITKRMFFICSM